MQLYQQVGSAAAVQAAADANVAVQVTVQLRQAFYWH
jgi:hypothetical protein